MDRYVTGQIDRLLNELLTLILSLSSSFYIYLFLCVCVSVCPIFVFFFFLLLEPQKPEILALSGLMDG